MFRKIYIKDFQSVLEAEIELGAVNVVVGGHGSGGGALTSALRRIDRILTGAEPTEISAAEFKVMAHYPEIWDEEIVLQINEQKYLRAFSRKDCKTLRYALQTQGRDFSFFVREKPKNGDLHGYSIKSSKDRVAIANHVLRTQDNRAFLTAVAIQNTGPDAPARQSGTPGPKLQHDGGNLAGVLRYLNDQQPNVFKMTEHALRRVNPAIERLRFETRSEGRVSLSFKDAFQPNTYAGLETIEGGVLRFLAILSALMREDLPAVIVLEQPDLELSSEAVTLVCEAVRSAAQRGAQVFITSHAPRLLNCFELDEIILAVRAEQGATNENRPLKGTTVFAKPDAAHLAQWPDDLGVGDLLHKNVLLSRG